MTIVVADGIRPALTQKQRIEQTIQTLLALQASENRDLAVERGIAEEVNEELHRGDNQDFMITAALEVSSAFWSRYLPKAWLDRRDDWRACAIQLCGSVEDAWRLERREPSKVSTYLDGFYLGVDLGYPEEMGEKWYLYLSDESGSYYVPIDAVRAVIGTGY